jgi:hypothetical protein
VPSADADPITNGAKRQSTAASGLHFFTNAGA